jgi:nitrite reductase (cytochrome c-552)
MPYKRQGGFKISDHHVRSPMLNINRACQGCHHFSEPELRSRVEAIQARFAQNRDVAMDAVVELIKDIEANQGKVSDENLNAARQYQRKAQFFVDYVEAENSMGFHGGGEALRILTEATDAARLGQLAMRGYKQPPPIRAPGVSKEAPATRSSAKQQDTRAALD